jgi:hypothetical protein
VFSDWIAFPDSRECSKVCCVNPCDKRNVIDAGTYEGMPSRPSVSTGILLVVAKTRNFKCQVGCESFLKRPEGRECESLTEADGIAVLIAVARKSDIRRARVSSNCRSFASCSCGRIAARIVANDFTC